MNPHFLIVLTLLGLYGCNSHSEPVVVPDNKPVVVPDNKPVVVPDNKPVVVPDNKPNVFRILNDTGITFCTNGSDILDSCDGRKQDATQGRDSVKYLNENGKVGFDFTLKDGCLHDKVTELMWELKNDDNRFDTYSLDSSSEIINTMNNNKYCGYNDWRLPSVDELISIVDYGKIYPSLDVKYFPKAKEVFEHSVSERYAKGYYLTSNKVKNELLVVDMNNGDSQYSYRSVNDDYYVRLVRGKSLEPIKSEKITYTIDDVVVERDLQTGLVFTVCPFGSLYSASSDKCSSGTEMDWDSALKLQTDGWRLPNIKELSYLTRLRDFRNSEYDSFWSSSPKHFLSRLTGIDFYDEALTIRDLGVISRNTGEEGKVILIRD